MDHLILSLIVGAVIFMIVRLVGERGFWILLVGGIGLAIFVFGNPPKYDPNLNIWGNPIQTTQYFTMPKSE
ncbi:MAG TPA: hypothetical protein VGI28_01835 [Stellaceae bacterium]|jgi:hypothetical protein